MKVANTLRARLTFWYVAALSVTLAAFAILLYAWMARTLYRHHDQDLLANGDRVASVLRSVPMDENSIAAVLARLNTPPPLLMVRDQAGELIYRSPLLQVAEPTIGQHEALIHAAAHAPRDPEFFTVALERSGAVRFICTPIERTPAAYVQVGNALGDVPTTLRTVGVASLILIPLVILLTSGGGWLLAGRALAPIRAIDGTLRAIEATGLSRRVEVHPADRELNSLVCTINGLLARLERAFQDLRDFTVDASHQLQTPLTIIKSSVELARRSPADQTATLLDDLEQEVNEISTVVADLQALSLADADIQRARTTELDLSGLSLEAIEILEALGEVNDVSVDANIEPDVVVWGDATKLKQVMLNLGDNAVKYTPKGGRVSIRLRREGREAVMQVADTGVGIPPHERTRIFDRFYRAPSADRRTRGTGLGLAIVKRIIEVHRGHIAVDSVVGQGTEFTVRLPLLHTPNAASNIPSMNT